MFKFELGVRQQTFNIAGTISNERFAHVAIEQNLRPRRTTLPGQGAAGSALPIVVAVGVDGAGALLCCVPGLDPGTVSAPKVALPSRCFMIQPQGMK
jgi:hypothetical protein